MVKVPILQRKTGTFETQNKFFRILHVFSLQYQRHFNVQSIRRKEKIKTL